MYQLVGGNSSDYKVNFGKAWYYGVNNVVASYGAAGNTDIRGLRK